MDGLLGGEFLAIVAAQFEILFVNDVEFGGYRFGIGDVINIEGRGENTKATVKFRNVGTKQLLLKFAKFKVIS